MIVLPLNGSTPRVYRFPGDVYYTHVVNAYENDTALTFDVVAYDDNPFLEQATLANWRTKEKRDAFGPSKVMRWLLYLAGPRAGTLLSSELGAPGRITDFTRINPHYQAVAYCLYWAVEWRHDDQNYASMAIVRQDVCSGRRTYFYRPQSYPSEATFVPRQSNKGEDDGVLLLTLLNGTSGTSSLLALDAASMLPLSETSLGNATIGFTT